MRILISSIDVLHSPRAQIAGPLHALIILYFLRFAPCLALARDLRSALALACAHARAREACMAVRAHPHVQHTTHAKSVNIDRGVFVNSTLSRGVRFDPRHAYCYNAGVGAAEHADRSARQV